jgi:translocation and assembly module TamA
MVPPFRLIRARPPGARRPYASLPRVALLALLLWPAAARPADPQPYALTLTPTGDAPLDQALHDSSTLLNLAKSSPVGPFALVVRAKEDLGRFEDALRSFGYYAARIEMSVAGHAVNDPALPAALEAAPAEPPVPIVVRVERGPQFTLGEIRLHGTVPDAARAALKLKTGAPALAADVLAARGRLLNALRDAGYALAEVDQPVATLHAAARRLDIDITVRTGPRVDLGPIAFEGVKGVNEAFLRRRLTLHRGERFDPKKIEAARQDLVGTGVFASVRAQPASALDAEGQLPLTFIVAERPRHAVKLGAAYSTDLGPGVTATWLDRNLFGNAETLALTANFQAGGSAQPRPGYTLSATFTKPDFLRRDQTLQADASAVAQTFDAYDEKSVGGDVQLKRRLSPHWLVNAGVAFQQSEITQQGVTRDYTLLYLPLGATYDTTDSVLNPTRGVRAAATVTPVQQLNDGNATFVLLQLAASGYLDLADLGLTRPGRSVLAVRGLIGDAVGASQFSLPPDKRFYAGGSGTVRGYKFQSVGPLFPDNSPQGGTSITAGSVEFRQRILQNYGVVAFMDAGQVAADSGPFTGTWRVGAGVGARYYTSFGPIRLDVAMPLTRLPGGDSFEVYIGIGQAF